MYGLAFRPSWHEDAKWVSGLLLVMSLALALFFFSLAQVTRREPAQSVLATALALEFTPESLAGDAAPLGLQPAFSDGFPGGTMTIAASGPSPSVLDQLAAVAYAQGTESALALVPDTQETARLEAALTPFGLFTSLQHRHFVRLSWLLGVLSLLLLGALLAFSVGRGRLFSVGAATAFAALPGVLLLAPLDRTLQAAPATAPPESGQAAGTLAYLPELVSYVRSGLPPGILETVFWNHLAVLALGLSLILLSFYLRQRQRSRPRRHYAWFR